MDITTPDAAISVSGIDNSPPIAEATLKKRRREYPATPEPPKEVQLRALREIVGQIFWIHVLGRRILVCAADKSKFVNRTPKLHEQFEKCLTEPENDFANINDIMEHDPGPRISAQITEYVKGISLDKAVTIIQDRRPNDFYGDILHLQTNMYHGSRRTCEQAEKNTSLRHEYLDIMTLRYGDNHKRLNDLLKALLALRNSVQQATESTLLVSEHLTALRKKFDCFEEFWPPARIAVADAGGPQHGASLINPKSERWWYSRVRNRLQFRLSMTFIFDPHFMRH